jgi:hypothetical protein
MQSNQENNSKMSEGDLSISRKEMTEHLGLFFTHVKYTMTLMFTMFTASIATLGFGLKEFKESEQFVSYLILASAIILILLYFVAKYSESLVSRYYKLYVSSYVYAARLEEKYSNNSHPWLDEICSRVGDIHNEDAVDKFINNEESDDNHSWHYYRNIILYLGRFSLILGILMLICFIWNFIKSLL